MTHTWSQGSNWAKVLKFPILNERQESEFDYLQWFSQEIHFRVFNWLEPRHVLPHSKVAHLTCEKITISTLKGGWKFRLIGWKKLCLNIPSISHHFGGDECYFLADEHDIRRRDRDPIFLIDNLQNILQIIYLHWILIVFMHRKKIKNVFLLEMFCIFSTWISYLSWRNIKNT